MKGVGGMVDPKNRGKDTRQKGPVSQDRLYKTLPILVDLASSKSASKTRDDARKMLRELLATTNWKTPYIMRALRVRRCRWLSSNGYAVIETKYLVRDPGGIESLTEWERRRG